MARTDGYGNYCKNKLDKLDEAFLFLISLTSIIFALLQVVLTPPTLMVFTFILLVIGVLLPFYYGFWRGALEDDPLLRSIGWVYLFLGIASYITATVISLLSKIFSVPFNATTLSVYGITLSRIDLKEIYLFLILAVMFSFMVIFNRILRTIKKVIDLIFKFSNKSPSKLDEHIIGAAKTENISYLPLISGFQSLLLCFLEEGMNVACPSTWPLMWGLLLLLFLFAIVVLKHIDIHRMLKYKECFKYIKPNEKIKKLNGFVSVILKVSIVLFLTSGLSILVLYIIYAYHPVLFQLIVRNIGSQTIVGIILVLLIVFTFDFIFNLTIMLPILIFINYFKEDVVFCNNITLWSYLKMLVHRCIHGIKKIVNFAVRF
jgi:hypothetical protein